VDALTIYGTAYGMVFQIVDEAERACDALPQSATTDAMRKATAALLATVA